jgi:hypothetical protein
MSIAFRQVLALALLTSAVTAQAVDSRAARGAPGSTTVPRFEPATCPTIQGVEWLANADCGYLIVAEDRSKPNGRTIQLMVARHRAQSPEKRADPILYLEGGPGDVAALEIDPIIKANFIRDRDILGRESARHLVLKAGADLHRTSSLESLLASAFIPRQQSAPIWLLPRPAAASSLPPAPISVLSIRARASPIWSTSVKCSAFRSGTFTGTHSARIQRRRLCATIPRGSAASS